MIWILGSSFLISLIAFVGALTLFLREKLLSKVLLVVVAFSTGTSIGGAFLHLMTEAITEIGADEGSILGIFLHFLLGFCVFFALEQLIRWHHHHTTSHPEIMPFSYLILVSDGIHNFIDGLVIAASFVVSFPIGVITSMVIALHEIPQEIGDFGVLVYGGFDKSRALILNYLSAITVIVGAVIGYVLSARIGRPIVFLLPFAAGNFVYTASTDLIPELQYKESLRKTLVRFLVFLSGIALMFAMRLL